MAGRPIKAEATGELSTVLAPEQVSLNMRIARGLNNIATASRVAGTATTLP